MVSTGRAETVVGDPARSGEKGGKLSSGSARLPEIAAQSAAAGVTGIVGVLVPLERVDGGTPSDGPVAVSDVLIDEVLPAAARA